jgi:hypothetical protein
MPLNRNFYSFAISISSLYAVIALIQGIIYFLLGQQAYSLAIFFSWYLFGNGLSLLGAFIILRYFHLKTFYLAFWTILFVTIASLIQFSVGFGTFMGMRELANYYMSAHMLVVGANILFGLALIFSVAGKRYWLKLTGIFSVLSGAVLMTAAIWYFDSTLAEKLLVLEKIYKWPSLLGWIGPALMMMNFLSEQKQLRLEGDGSSSSQTLDSLMTVTRVIALFAALFLGLKFTTEALTRLSWDQNLERKEKEWETVWGARTFAGTDGNTLKYQLIKPLDFDPSKKYPMVVCLPYGGGIEGSPAAKLLLNEINRKKYQAFLFVPFCSKGIGWGGIPNYPTIDTLVFESIEALESEFNEIDVNRVYVTGVSRGGYGSWHFISLRPDLFAAAMPVCGGGDPNLLTPNIIDVDVWAFHGENDINVPVSGSRDMIAAIKKSGGNPKYTEFEGAGHDIWGYITKTPGVLDWMFEQKREH